MEGSFWEKFGLLLIITGLIVAGIGAAASFSWGTGLAVFFYLGFIMAMFGFAIAVLTKFGDKKENK